MPFGSLWVPVIVSAVVVFVGSSILHMALRYHRADIKALPNEDAVRDALGKGSPAPGLYFTPYCHMKQMGEPAITGSAGSAHPPDSPGSPTAPGRLERWARWAPWVAPDAAEQYDAH